VSELGVCVEELQNIFNGFFSGWGIVGRRAYSTNPNEEEANLVQAARNPSKLEVGSRRVEGLIEIGASNGGGECGANGTFLNPVADGGVAMPAKWAGSSVRVGVRGAGVLRRCVTEIVREHRLQVSSDKAFSGVWVVFTAICRGVVAMGVV